jgi:[acyl-carrier-protein] S-malonyltransferase
MDGGLFDAPGAGKDLYERFPIVRELYGQVANWVGIPSERLLTWELPRLHEHRRVGAIRQAVISLAVCDVLAEHGILPDAAGGISLGGMIAACVAGAIDRPDLFALLGYLRDAPAPPGPPQAAAVLVLPADLDVTVFMETAPGDVYLAIDNGRTADGGHHVFVLSGYEAALQELAARPPTGRVRILPDLSVAFHSPLSQYLREFIEPALDTVAFRPPSLPLTSAMGQGPLATADQVRDTFLLNQVTMVSLPSLAANLARFDTEVAVLAGPGSVDRFSGAMPFPVIHIETADQLTDGLATLYELGINPAIGI